MKKLPLIAAGFLLFYCFVAAADTIKLESAYYFAYGSNLNHGQMKQRCPTAKFIKRVFLKDYRFCYDGYSSRRAGGTANIIPAKDGIVWGALFAIDEKCLTALDGYEGYPHFYQRKEFEVNDDAGEAYHATAYFHEARQPSLPSENYRQIIFEGARQCELPEAYIREAY